MKLVRYGPAGKEKPGLVDADGKLRDLSRKVKDINAASLSYASLSALRDTDLLDPARLDVAARECEAFYDFSIQLFERMSQRELAGVPFDRPAAARSLKLYLGD